MIVIAANSYDKKFLTVIQNILSRNFQVAHYLNGYLDARCESPEFIITDSASLNLIYCNMAVVIFHDAKDMQLDFECEKPTIAIVNSCNKDAIQIVSKKNFPAITCGLSAKDTITLSSIKEDSALINLQRCITCFNNTVAEPQEIPVKLFTSIDSFSLMCAATIFILSGNINKLPGSLI